MPKRHEGALEVNGVEAYMLELSIMCLEVKYHGIKSISTTTNFYPSHFPEAKVARVPFRSALIEISGCAWDTDFLGIELKISSL